MQICAEVTFGLIVKTIDEINSFMVGLYRPTMKLLSLTESGMLKHSARADYFGSTIMAKVRRIESLQKIRNCSETSYKFFSIYIIHKL